MSLTIQFIDGPLKDHALFEFPDSVQAIGIGREADCQVVFPANFTEIGRRHLTIRQVGGRYKLETNPANPVLIDGREPFDGEPLGKTSEVALGASRIRMRVTTSMSSDLPDTDLTPIRLTASQRFYQQRRFLSGIGIVLLLVAAGLMWNFVQQYQERQKLAAVLADMAKIKQVSIAPAVLKKVSESVYLVLTADAAGKESPVGTAWVYDRGHLATNAHVAQAFLELSSGQKLIARGTVAPFSTVEIQSIVAHPDYNTFTAEWQNNVPGRVLSGGAVDFVQPPGAGYDVALMKVAPGTTLSAPLPVADINELNRLKAGIAVAFAGFPMELLAGGGVNPKAPIPQTQVGNITAVSDYFLLPATDAERHLIQHSLFVTGGASGSPMVDSEGRVIGLVSGMNIVEVSSGRAPNAAGVNFAQRADLLKELVDKPTETAEKQRRAAWQTGFETFDKPNETIPLQILRTWRSNIGATADPVAIPTKTADLVKDTTNGGYYFVFTDVFTEPGRYLVVAISNGRKDIDLAVVSSGERVAENTDYDWYPSATIDATSRNATTVVVYADGKQMSDQTSAASDATVSLMAWRLPLAQ